jgi:hypothetical protein
VETLALARREASLLLTADQRPRRLADQVLPGRQYAQAAGSSTAFLVASSPWRGSLKLPEALDAQLSEQAQRRRLSKSELVRRALTAFLQASEDGLGSPLAPSAVDLVAVLVGCCQGGAADLSCNPACLAGFGER